MMLARPEFSKISRGLANGGCQVHDEESLVRRAKERDQEAFARLYEENFDRIYRYVALRIGDKTEAEDMTQQVFFNALQSISSFKWQGVPFSAWLFRIAHNQVVDYLRKKKKPVAVFAVEELPAADESRPELIAEHSLDIEQLLSALPRLTEAQREVVSLRFSGDLPIAEIARIMGKSQGAIKALQHSAIVALRKALSVGKNGEVQRV